MFLSAKNNIKLDSILKSYEVGYRSYVADKIVSAYPNHNSFQVEIDRIKKLSNSSSIALSQKYSKKIDNINNEIIKKYSIIKDCYESFVNQDYENTDVLYVSELIDYVFILFDPLFINLAKDFLSLEQFIYLQTLFHKTRNALSHPASAKIRKESAKELMSFTSKLIKIIPDKYFWYYPKADIRKDIEVLARDIEINPIKIHNLEQVPFSNEKLLLRESEINNLKKLFYPHQNNFRTSGSTVIYGYGGVGKTSLVVYFIYELIKDSFDGHYKENIDFILFFTNKEEILTYQKTTGELVQQNLQKQINSFEELERRICQALNIDSIDNLSDSKGYIVIDNFENLDTQSKEKIYTFIKRTSRNVHFILTSREEEKCEDKIHLKEFDENNYGSKFITEYITEYSLDIKENEIDKDLLVKSCKGNTLILVLSLQRISEHKTSFEKLISELNNVSSGSIDVITNFMYKNTFDETIQFLEKKDYHPQKIFTILSVYDSPLDIHAIKSLTDLGITEAEEICNTLATRLILNKVNEAYYINDFAYKFIIMKYRGVKTEVNAIIEKIRKYRKNLQEQKDKLEARKADPKLLEIINDWKPVLAVDKIAFAEVFSAYDDARKIHDYMYKAGDRADQNSFKRDLDRLLDLFEKNESLTSQPYIKFQKARVLQIFLDLKNDESNKLIALINNAFEEAYIAIEVNYKYIKKTKSYASFLWIYAIFMDKHMNESDKALAYLEESRNVFENLGIADSQYYKVLNDLSYSYFDKYKTSKEKEYLNEVTKLYKIVKDRSNIEIKIDFDFEKYFQFYNNRIKPLIR